MAGMQRGPAGAGMLDTAVALSVFDRPDTTRRVFRAIAEARPKRLFVFADGPRSNDEAARCHAARAVTADVDWDCDVAYDFSDDNLGARRRYASGVEWVFSEVDEAIVLDDDCLPDPSFFAFAAEMLELYRDDPRVMMVCGTNYLERWKDDVQSYHFSHLGSVWGWATWKRAWDFYDVSMAAWGDDDVKERIRGVLDDEQLYTSYARRFDRLYNDSADRHSWDLPWYFARLAQAGLTVVPSVNLVANLGNADGRGLPPLHPLASIPVSPMPFPLRHPAAVTADREYDRRHVRRIYEWWELRDELRTAARGGSSALHRRIGRRVRRWLGAAPARSARTPSAAAGRSGGRAGRTEPDDLP